MRREGGRGKVRSGSPAVPGRTSPHVRMRPEGQLVTWVELSPGRALQGKTESERRRQVTGMPAGPLGAQHGAAGKAPGPADLGAHARPSCNRQAQPATSFPFLRRLLLSGCVFVGGRRGKLGFTPGIHLSCPVRSPAAAPRGGSPSSRPHQPPAHRGLCLSAGQVP